VLYRYTNFKIVLIALIALMASCKKTTNEASNNVLYEVIIPNNTAVTINYNSDYYYATNTRKAIVYAPNEYVSKYWRGEHYAAIGDEVFINATYSTTDTAIKVSEFAINVYVKDTLYKSVKGASTLEIKQLLK
jgi:hypothetical protein